MLGERFGARDDVFFGASPGSKPRLVMLSPAVVPECSKMRGFLWSLTETWTKMMDWFGVEIVTGGGWLLLVVVVVVVVALLCVDG